MLIAAATSPALGQDKAKPAAVPAKAEQKDERQVKPFVDNEKVRVTETVYPAGSSSGMQPRGERVVRALNDGMVEKTYADGKKETIQWKAGQVRYSPKETYSQKNIGKKELRLFVVNLK
jgi:hypothetical protein